MPLDLFPREDIVIVFSPWTRLAGRAEMAMSATLLVNEEETFTSTTVVQLSVWNQINSQSAALNFISTHLQNAATSLVNQFTKRLAGGK